MYLLHTKEIDDASGNPQDGQLERHVDPRADPAQLGLERTADLPVRAGVIDIRPIRRHPRGGRADNSRQLDKQGRDALVWPDMASEGGVNLVW